LAPKPSHPLLKIITYSPVYSLLHCGHPYFGHSNFQVNRSDSWYENVLAKINLSTIFNLFLSSRHRCGLKISPAEVPRHLHRLTLTRTVIVLLRENPARRRRLISPLRNASRGHTNARECHHPLPNCTCRALSFSLRRLPKLAETDPDCRFRTRFSVNCRSTKTGSPEQCATFPFANWPRRCCASRPGGPLERRRLPDLMLLINCRLRNVADDARPRLPNVTPIVFVNEWKLFSRGKKKKSGFVRGGVGPSPSNQFDCWKA
jgi:hypothetical protein